MSSKKYNFGLLILAFSIGILSISVDKVSAVAMGNFSRHSSTGNAVVEDMSADGRYLVFRSNLSNIVPNDTNGKTDIFIRDTTQNITTRLSVSTPGIESNGDSYSPTISADGRFVSFYSYGSNLVSNDTNAVPDVFLIDRKLNKITLESVNPSGQIGDKVSWYSYISDDGEYLAFTSRATNLLPGTASTSNTDHVYLKSLITNTLTRISVNQLGNLSNGTSYRAVISADNEYIAFESSASNLLLTSANPNNYDNNSKTDIYRFATRSRTFELVSASTAGAPSNGNSSTPSISSDGRYIAYASTGTDITPVATVGIGQVYVRDMVNSTSEMIATNFQNTAQSGNKNSDTPRISGDGQLVIFRSASTDLINNDVYHGSNPSSTVYRVYVKDRTANTTSIASVVDDGQPLTYFPEYNDVGAVINNDGNKIAFSTIQRLVPEDTNNLDEIYTREISN